jgi:hypothetical protein
VRESIQCEKVEWQTDLDEPSAGGGGFEGWSSEGPLMTVLVEFPAIPQSRRLEGPPIRWSVGGRTRWSVRTSTYLRWAMCLLVCRRCECRQTVLESW